MRNAVGWMLVVLGLFLGYAEVFLPARHPRDEPNPSWLAGDAAYLSGLACVVVGMVLIIWAAIARHRAAVARNDPPTLTSVRASLGVVLLVLVVPLMSLRLLLTTT